MEEIEILVCMISVHHLGCQLVILCKDLRQILCLQCIIFLIRSYYRLHRDLLESQICQMKHVVGEILVVLGKCTAHIIFFLIPALCQLFKLRQNQIIASFSVTERSHTVVNFLTSIDTQDHVVHLTVCELLYLIVQQNAIGCQSKTESLIMKLLLLSSVCNQVFDNLPVHQRLATEEIHFQIVSASGIGNQEIQCLLTYLVAHKSTTSMILAFFCKAVTTGQITIMGNVQTQCLNYRLLCLHNIVDIIFINILCIEFSGFDQLVQIFCCLPDLSFRVLIFQKSNCLIQSFFLVIRNHIVDQIIYHMDRSTVYIQQNIITIVLILMNHVCFPFCSVLYIQYFLCFHVVSMTKKKQRREPLLTHSLKNSSYLLCSQV